MFFTTLLAHPQGPTPSGGESLGERASDSFGTLRALRIPPWAPALRQQEKIKPKTQKYEDVLQRDTGNQTNNIDKSNKSQKSTPTQNPKQF